MPDPTIELERVCECGNCPSCRQWIIELSSIIALLDRVRAEHMSDGDGGCGGCGQPLPILLGDDGQPLHNPYIRHHHEQMALAILLRQSPPRLQVGRPTMSEHAETAGNCGHPNHGAQDHDCAPFSAEIEPNVAAALAIHKSRTLIFFTCGEDDCDHVDGDCPQTPMDVCAGCWELAETVAPYFTDRPVPDQIMWPCPTAEALGVRVYRPVVDGDA